MKIKNSQVKRRGHKQENMPSEYFAQSVIIPNTKTHRNVEVILF